MKLIASLLFLLLMHCAAAQCPFAVTLTKTGSHCLGKEVLEVHSTDTLLKIQWYKDNALVKTNLAVKEQKGITVAGGHGRGSGGDQLDQPTGVFVDSSGNVYVADVFNSRIEKWAPGAANGFAVAGDRTGQRGDSARLLSGPSDVYVDAGGNIFIADEGNNRIQEWKKGDTAGITVAGGNGQGTEADQLTIPWSIGFDANGNMYVADLNRVQKFPPGSVGGTKGQTVAGNAQGYTGPETRFFAHLLGIYVDSAGNIYAADQNNNRVVKWLPGAKEGIIVAGGNGMGNAANQLNGPQDVWVDNAGNIYVSEIDRVQKWAPGATEGITVAGGNGPGDAPNQLNVPSGVALDKDGNLYVADRDNNRVQKFIYLPVVDTTYIPTEPGTYTAAVTDSAGCTTITNPVVIEPAASVSITASDTVICTGDTVSFKAVSANTDTLPLFNWLVNGKQMYSNASAIISNTFEDKDIIMCMLEHEEGCPDVTSNAVQLSVNPLPEVKAQTVLLAAGAGITLQPSVSGNIISYSWSPGATLTNSSIKNPVATPLTTTDYTLNVSSPGGCIASGITTVEVLNSISIPAAFTPNGDGLNDRFYILGGPADAAVKELSVFNRWGKKIFTAHNASLNDSSTGWDGTVNNKPADTGAYIYTAVIASGGKEVVYRGTVMLMR